MKPSPAKPRSIPGGGVSGTTDFNRPLNYSTEACENSEQSASRYGRKISDSQNASPEFDDYPENESSFHLPSPLSLSLLVPAKLGVESISPSPSAQLYILATRQPSGFVFRGGRCRTAFRAKTHQRRPPSHGELARVTPQ